MTSEGKFGSYGNEWQGTTELVCEQHGTKCTCIAVFLSAKNSFNTSME